jgi:hypothetical protein
MRSTSRSAKKSIRTRRGFSARDVIFGARGVIFGARDVIFGARDSLRFRSLWSARFGPPDRRRPKIRRGARVARRRGEAVSHMIKHAIQRADDDAASRDAARIDVRRSGGPNLRRSESASAWRRRSRRLTSPVPWTSSKGTRDFRSLTPRVPGDVIPRNDTRRSRRLNLAPWRPRNRNAHGPFLAAITQSDATRHR